MYTTVVSFYPSFTSLAQNQTLLFPLTNTVTSEDLGVTGGNGGSAVIVALFKDGFQRDQAE